jgi:hypothetical protein
MNEDFFVTLPSNVKHGKNTASHFRVVLPKTIQLTGRWQCALVEISYPRTYYNVRAESLDGKSYEHIVTIVKSFEKNEVEGELVSVQKYTLHISDGNYNTASELCAAINDQIANVVKLPAMFSIENKFNGRVLFQKPDSVRSVTLSQTFAYKLGFKNQTLKESELAQSVYDMHGGVDHLWVNSDIVENQVVGDTMAPLIRTVAVSGSFGDIISTVYPVPHYVGVVCNEFSSIEITINTDANRPVVFTAGKTIVVLHFRYANRIRSI